SLRTSKFMGSSSAPSAVSVTGVNRLSSGFTVSAAFSIFPAFCCVQEMIKRHGYGYRGIRCKGLFKSRYLLDVRHPECDEISNLGDKNYDDSLNTGFISTF